MSQETSRIVVKSRRTSGNQAQGQALRTRANGFALWVTMFVAALSPLPLGSARPLAWSFWAVYVGAMALIYVIVMQRSQQPYRVDLASLKFPAALFGALLAYLVFTILPIGSLFGGFQIVGRYGFVGSSNTLSIDPSATVLMLLRQCTYGALFFLALQVAAHPARREIAVKILLWTCLAYGFLGIVALYTGDWILGLKKWAYLGSATGPFVNRNSYATYLAFGSVIATAKLARHVADRFERHYDDGPIQNSITSILLYSMALLFLLAVIVATQSRMGFAAALVGIFVVIVTTAARTAKAGTFIIGSLVVGIVLAVSALSLFGEALFDRFGAVEESSIVRTDLYAQVIDLIRLRPWTGFGGGSFELAFPLVHQLPVNLDFLWDKAHNTYLTLWSELGLVAGSIPLAIIAILVWRTAFVSRVGATDSRFRSMSLGAVAVAAVHSLADFSLEIQANAILFVIVLALGLPVASEKSKS